MQNLDDNDNHSNGFIEILAIFLCCLIIICTLPFSLFACLRVAQDYEKVVLFRYGIKKKSKGPGIFFVIPCTDQYVKIDLRTMTFDIPPQEILTKDSVTISVDAVVYAKVHNPAACIINIENPSKSTRLLASSTLRNILGTKSLQEILACREQIADSMQHILDNATYAWGTTVERIELKDVHLPEKLQRAMASEAEAARDAKAKVIAAIGERDASFVLKDAAKNLRNSKTALRLRYLQTLSSISAEQHSTFIVPVPNEYIK
ncbi:hypothetical protein SNEBB_000868 [Seison nebaliae]|nr:hypothetical protein SNEBB_000868 [Seison nebaliae]